MLVLSSAKGMSSHHTRLSATGNVFPETRWTLIDRLRQHGGARDQALEILCRLYWQPLCLYARRLGFGREDAEDLTQDFLGQGPGTGLFANAEAARGTLRAYLMAAFQRYAVSEWRRQASLKRGGFIPHAPLDEAWVQGWLALTPEEAADQAWAATILREVETSLEKDYERRGRGELFRRLRPLLAWYATEADDHTARIARDCGLNPGAVRSALHRLRSAYRREIESLLGHLVRDPDEIREETRHLLRLWGREDSLE